MVFPYVWSCLDYKFHLSIGYPKYGGNHTNLDYPISLKKGFWALVWTGRNKALWLSTNDCMMDLVNGATSFLPNDCKANANHYQNKSKSLSDERRRGQRILLSCKWQIILVLSLEHQDKSFPTFFNTRKNNFDLIILPNLLVFAKMVKQTSSCQSWTHNRSIVQTGNACRRTIRVADRTSCRKPEQFWGRVSATSDLNSSSCVMDVDSSLPQDRRDFLHTVTLR